MINPARVGPVLEATAHLLEAEAMWAAGEAALRRDPFHFVEAAANVLTNPTLDPRAKIPEFKVCAVRLEPPAQ